MLTFLPVISPRWISLFKPTLYVFWPSWSVSSTVILLPLTTFVCFPASCCTAWSWLPLMASVESAAIRPAATPLILPLWSMVTLLLIVTVPPFPMRIEDEPLVIDSIPVKSLFKPIFTLVPSLVPSLVTVKLVSSGLKSTVSPGLTVVVPPWAVVRFQPLLAVSVAESALLLTCFNCATLTASVSSLPAATCVIWRVIFFSVSPTETAPCVDIQVDWAISLIWVGAKAPFSPAALSATDDVPKATPPYTLAWAAAPKATAFSAVACDALPIAVEDCPVVASLPRAIDDEPTVPALVLFKDLASSLPW